MDGVIGETSERAGYGADVNFCFVGFTEFEDFLRDAPQFGRAETVIVRGQALVSVAGASTGHFSFFRRLRH